MIYEVRFIAKTLFTEKILTFQCEKPEPYEFSAGQYCFMSLPEKGMLDERGLRRHLSITSSPSDNELSFATKLSGSAFKRTLKEISIGETIKLEKPMGRFVPDNEHKERLVFIAGGIGITPFRSMIRYSNDMQTGHAITLLYSNKVQEEALFLDELQSMAHMNEKLSVIATMTRTNESEQWSGLRGRIDESMIQENVSEWQKSTYYIAGPPAMVDGMQGILQGMGIAPEQIKIERFTGYK